MAFRELNVQLISVQIQSDKTSLVACQILTTFLKFEV